VVPGKTGLVFEAGNIDALRDALATALDERNDLAAWGAAARAHAAAYSYDEATRGMVQALGAVLAARAGP
jgi:hypothetical protein